MVKKMVGHLKAYMLVTIALNGLTNGQTFEDLRACLLQFLNERMHATQYQVPRRMKRIL